MTDRELMQQEPMACVSCIEAHAILDADASQIIRNAKDGYPEGRAARELTLAERVKALCIYASDWKRWCMEAEATPPRREWVGLTEADKLVIRRRPWETPEDLINIVEAALKEKNT